MGGPRWSMLRWRKCVGARALPPSAPTIPLRQAPPPTATTAPPSPLLPPPHLMSTRHRHPSAALPPRLPTARRCCSPAARRRQKRVVVTICSRKVRKKRGRLRPKQPRLAALVLPSVFDRRSTKGFVFLQTGGCVPRQKTGHVSRRPPFAARYGMSFLNYVHARSPPGGCVPLQKTGHESRRHSLVARYGIDFPSYVYTHGALQDLPSSGRDALVFCICCIVAITVLRSFSCWR